MNRVAMTQALMDSGVVAILRADAPDLLLDVSRALAAGGVRAIEVTMTTPGALEVIAKVARELGDECLIGAGTVLDAETARACILAGAQFLVSPITHRPTIEMAHRYDKAILPGAFSPTEMQLAWDAGADIVKVFPSDLLGPGYLKTVKAPLPHLRLCPTGGVTPENVAQWIEAGACCVGAGSSLVSKKLLAERNLDGITQMAAKFVAAVKAARK